MTLELLGEDRVSLNELATELKVDRTTIRRWTTAGYAGERLAVLRIGKRQYSTRQAVARFLAAINGETGCIGGGHCV